MKNHRPDFIFTGGMPRSGTSLIGQLIGEAEGVSNTITDNSIINYFHRMKAFSFNLKESDAEKATRELLELKTVRKWNLNIDEVMDVAKERKPQNWYELSLCFFIAKKKKDNCTIYIKSPELEYYFPIIHDLLPEEYSRRFIHVVRNPRNAYLSMKYSSLAWKRDKIKIKDTSLNWSVRWNTSFDRYAFNKEYLEGNIYLVQHEQNVTDRTGTLKGLFEYLGLELTDEIINFQNKRDSSHQGYQDIDRSITPSEESNIRANCYYGMKYLGYLENDEKPLIYQSHMPLNDKLYTWRDLVSLGVKKAKN